MEILQKREKKSTPGREQRLSVPVSKPVLTLQNYLSGNATIPVRQRRLSAIKFTVQKWIDRF
jgi:hypothetical protein